MRKNLNIHPSIKLADPEFHKPAPIDLLIGAGPTLSLLSASQLSLSSDHDLILQKTKIGWILGGGCSRNPKSNQRGNCMVTHPETDFKQFREINDIPRTTSFTEDEKFCEEHF